MINFFGTNNVVPNGYIYTSHKGSEYIFLEGFWFNHSNLQMVDPNKTTKMNEAAVKQILEHNSTEKSMIGESFKFAGKDCVYIGRNKFTEDGVIVESAILTELIADEQRVYDVSRETLQKEWNDLKFNILPPHAEDITIPPGMEIQGFKYSPKGQRFIDLKTGSHADPQMTRKLYDAALRLARQHANSHTLIPLNSTLVLSNKRGQWNGTDFCDSEGNSIVPRNNVKGIFDMYQKFVSANPNDFQTLSSAGNKEQRYGLNTPERTPVTEAVTSKDLSNFKPGDPNSVEIPNRFQLGDYIYVKSKKGWMNGSDLVTDKQFDKELRTEALAKIKEMDAEGGKYPINSTVDYQGDTITWNGTDWVGTKGKKYRSSDFWDALDEYIASNPESTGESSSEIEIQGAEGGLVKGKSRIVDKHGKVYIYQGGESFVNPDDDTELPKEVVKPHLDALQNHLNGGTNSSNADQGNGPGEVKQQPATQTQPTAPAATASVPDGYTITSKAGVRYFKKAGQWISSQTKKAMNSSAAKSIERAAEAKIDQFNASSPVKIGDKWKSGKGKEYTYVGDDRFMSADGKMVPKNSAQQILDKMRVNSTETSTPDGAVDSTEVQSDVVDTAPKQQAPAKPESNSPAAPKSNASGLEGLAERIKSHPQARKIKILLTRGDKVSLLAADILLSGKEKNAVEILKALNSSDE